MSVTLSLTQSPSLQYTGERMIPEVATQTIFWNHVYRYRFACRFAKDKRVLDIACGEGYGTKALSIAGASSVIGIDISEEACTHARNKYGIDARTGTAEQIPLPDKCMDLVVSFETIEHISGHDQFLDECDRVLADNGTLVISTPNREVYSEHGHHNSFHCKELNEHEFTRLLASRFSNIAIYTQYLQSAKWWSVRSFGAVTSPWMNIRGFWRTREFARRVLCPHAHGDPKPKWKSSPEQAVLSYDVPLASLVNPYCIRPMRRIFGERPYYYIAVATR